MEIRRFKWIILKFLLLLIKSLLEIHLVPYTIPYNLVKRYVSEYMEQEYVTYINPNGIWEELTNIIFDENDIKELLNINSIMDYEFYKQNKNL